MPLPIQSLNNWNDDENNKVSMESLGLSDIQIQLLGISTGPTREAKITVSDRHLNLLKTIDKNQDDLVTAASLLNNIKDAKVCKVPETISDNELLGLKTAGLVSGNGRSVSLTDSGRLALRDHYLSQETVNEFRKNRAKSKFDYNEAASVKVASKNSKFKKTWLTDNFEGQFDIRFIADKPASLSKGLMHAEPLDDFEVAYFIFSETGNHSFWNKNVSFPLTLAFLDRNNKIVDFKDLEEHQTESVSAKSNSVKYVVEANKNLFKELDIQIGDVLEQKDKKLILHKRNK